MQKSTRTKMQFMHQNYVFYKLDTEIFPDIGNTGKSFSCLYPCLAVFFLSSCDSQFVDGQPFVYNGIQHSAIEATCCTEILQLFPR